MALVDGQVVDAACGALRGLDALRELFLVPGGPVRLIRAPVEGRPLGGTLALVMEGCRLADEWDRLAPMVLLDEGDPDERLAPVLGALDGHRTLYDVVRSVGVPVAPAVDLLLRRLEAGSLVEVAEPRVAEVRARIAAAAAPSTSPSGDGPPPGSAPDYDAALEAGRRHLRAGDHDRAEAAFRAALEARPGDRIATQNLRRARVLRDAGPGPALRETRP